MQIWGPRPTTLEDLEYYPAMCLFLFLHICQVCFSLISSALYDHLTTKLLSTLLLHFSVFHYPRAPCFHSLCWTCQIPSGLRPLEYLFPLPELILLHSSYDGPFCFVSHIKCHSQRAFSLSSSRGTLSHGVSFSHLILFVFFSYLSLSKVTLRVHWFITFLCISLL